MNKKNTILSITIIIILFILGLFIFIDKFIIIPYMNDINLCERNFDFPETIYLDTPNAWYKNLDINHYNCCYYDIINTSNGYKTEIICEGFIK